MLDVMKQDYIRTAWSKGLHERSVIIRHALKNSLMPVVTLSGMGLSMIIGGSVIVETVFNIPGVGLLAYQSIVHGANGILYWGTAYTQKPSQFWSDLRSLVSELAAMEDAFCAMAKEKGLLAAFQHFAAPDVTFIDTDPRKWQGQAAVLQRIGRAGPPAAGTMYKRLSGRMSSPLRHSTNTIQRPSGETLGNVLLIPFCDAPAMGSGTPPAPLRNGTR